MDSHNRNLSVEMPSSSPTAAALENISTTAIADAAMVEVKLPPAKRRRSEKVELVDLSERKILDIVPKGLGKVREQLKGKSLYTTF